MSLGPTVIRPDSVPFPTVACSLFAVFFAIQAVMINRWMTMASLAIALVFAIVAWWFWFQARRSLVLIDTHQFIVKDGHRERTFDTAEVETVDLSSPSGHIRFKDGTSVALPLEGRPLVRAGMLLSPGRTRR